MAFESAADARLSGLTLVRRWLERGSPFVALIFLSFLFIGGDLLAGQAGGITIRAVSVALIGAFLLMFLNRWPIAFDRAMMVFFLLLTIAGALSCVTSYDTTRSIGYTFWVLFDFFVIVTLFFNFARRYPIETTRKVWFAVYRIHVLLIFVEIAIGLSRGVLVRAHLWFYESSYLAIFLTGYFASSLYLFTQYGRRYAFDTVLATISLLSLASMTGIFGIIFSLVLVVLFSPYRMKIAIYTVAIVAVFVAILAIWFHDTVYYQSLFGIFTGPDVLTDLLGRSGNRWVRALVGWEAFQSHPWFGIGIGADSTYMGTAPFSDQDYQYIHPWTFGDDTGTPFDNITIEVLGTMGIVGFLPYLCLIVYVVMRMIKMRTATADEVFVFGLFLAFVATFLALQGESTFLRFYLWSPLGLAMGAASRLANRAPVSL
jgi:O-antigen ligase